MHSRNLTLLFLLLCPILLLAQNPWDFTDESDISLTTKDRRIIPQKYLTAKVDLLELKQILDAAPDRYNRTATDQETILALPMPDGSFQNFRIEKASIMHEDLQRQFPQIQSYAGVGIDDPTALLRFDLTQKGFHAQVLTGKTSSVYIDPYSRGNIVDYVVYYKKDFFKRTSFECLVDGITHDVSNERHSSSSHRQAGDCQLRQYRLALSCTGEYATYHGGNVPDVLAAMNTTMTRVNGVFERDIAVTMELVPNNSSLIYLDASTDPFSNNNSSALLNENQTTCDNVIGSANYDIGHVFSTGGGGIAQLNSPCGGGKARGVTGQSMPEGDPFDIDYVAHEMGHQYGANHTQNNSCNRNSSTAMEPGSASSIMGYAGICNPNVQNNSDDYFHAISIQEMMANITGGNSSSCATFLTTNNSQPICTVGGNHTIPVSTPFVLTGSATDADGDALTYCWEQMDNQVATMPPVSTNTGGPTFRTLDPTADPFRYFPSLDNIVDGTTDTWEVLPSVSRTMNFRLTVRDNHMGSGCTDEEDIVITTTADAGPFLVLSPNTAVNWAVSSNETVTWDVAGTDGNGVNCANVDILLSTNGGLTYPITLASSVPNDGSHSVSVPNNPTTTARVMIMCSDNVFLDVSDSDFVIEFTGPTFTMETTPSAQEACDDNTATYNINLTSVLGFSDPVTLSATGLPAGAIATFTPQTLTPTGTTVMTVSNLSNTSGSYLISVIGNGGGQSVSEEVTLDVDMNISTTPILTSPMDGAVDQGLDVEFEWSAVTHASSYDMQIATDAAFGELVDSKTGLANTNTISENLDISTTYYWRARGVSFCGAGSWSQTYTFTTYACDYVNLNLVLDNYASETTWSIVSNGTTYLSGGPYTDGTNGQVVLDSVCLPNGCYDFIINDSYGDGICCGYGNGSYTLTDGNNNLIATGGDFDSSETVNFCVNIPTCTDGIMNGDETGVDCGGSNCPSCSQDIFVDESASGNNDGTSWMNAFNDLQDALAIGTNATIHIAEGMYKPTTTTTRGISFDIPSGCTVLGGYPAGGGTRNPEAHETSLSGNIDNNPTVAGDSYHVVTVKDATNVTLDGVSIRDGNADDTSSFARARGGGLYVKNSTLTILNSQIKWNKAVYGGGIFATLSPNVTMKSCDFKNNRSYLNGSAIYHSNTTSMFIESCKITKNVSDRRAAVEVNNSFYTSMENTLIADNQSNFSNALALVATNRDQTCDIYNCTITGEERDKYLINLQIGFGDLLGLNIYNSIVAHQDPTLTKGIKTYQNGTLNLLTDHCYIQGSTVPGTSSANIYTETDAPLSLNPDYSLPANSAAVDGGDNSLSPQLVFDIDGNTRVVNGTIDMGAYEYQNVGTREIENGIEDFLDALDVLKPTFSVYPNPTESNITITSNVDDVQISLYNLLGEQVMQTQDLNIDMRSLPSGIYLLNIHKNGKILGQQKVMKK